MHFFHFAVPALGLLLAATPALSDATSCGSEPPSGCVDISPQWRETIVSNFYTLWGGDYSYLNKTFAPNVVEYQDRVPTGNGNGSVPLIINNSTALLRFIMAGHAAYSTFRFEDDLHFGIDNLIAARWTLHAVYKSGLAHATITPGSPVSYNGTDILILDRCTGLIAEVLSASDSITNYHQLGVPLNYV